MASVFAAGAATLASILGWKFLFKGILPPIIRVCVRRFVGPLTSVPELIQQLLTAKTDPESVLILLASQTGPTLIVRAAYLLIRSTLKGSKWVVVKVVSSTSSLGWCLIKKLFFSPPKEEQKVEAPIPIPIAHGEHFPLTPQLFDDFSYDLRSSQEEPEPSYVWEQPPPPPPSADIVPMTIGQESQTKDVQEEQPSHPQRKTSNLVVVNLTDGQEEIGQRQFEESLKQHTKQDLEVTPAELGNFICMYDKAHQTNNNASMMNHKTYNTPLERFLRQWTEPSAPPAPSTTTSSPITTNEQQEQQQLYNNTNNHVETQNSLTDDWVELTSSAIVQPSKSK